MPEELCKCCIPRCHKLLYEDQLYFTGVNPGDPRGEFVRQFNLCSEHVGLADDLMGLVYVKNVDQIWGKKYQSHETGYYLNSPSSDSILYEWTGEISLSRKHEGQLILDIDWTDDDHDRPASLDIDVIVRKEDLDPTDPDVLPAYSYHRLWSVYAECPDLPLIEVYRNPFLSDFGHQVVSRHIQLAYDIGRERHQSSQRSMIRKSKIPVRKSTVTRQVLL